MPLVERATLELVDVALNVAGVLCVMGLAVWMVRSGEWRSALRDIPQTQAGPTLLHVAAVLAAYVVLVSGLFQALGFTSDSINAAGTSEWHRFQLLDAVVKIALTVLICALLRMSGPLTPHADRTPASITGRAVAAVVVALALLPICFTQQYAGELLWRWIQPGITPPQHGVIDAVTNTEWGKTGLVQLFIVAVIVAPFAEELFFRGLVLGALWRHVGLAWFAILGSSALFGLVHSRQPQDVLPLITMGLVLGYVRFRSGSLALCVGIHSLFNLRTMAFILLNPEMAVRN